MYRQWTNPTMSVPAEQPVQSQIQVPKENTNRNTENAPSKPEVSDKKSTSSRISLRTGVSQKPPRLPILGQISTSRRFEKQTVQQRNDGSRFKSYTKRDRKGNIWLFHIKNFGLRHLRHVVLSRQVLWLV